MDSHNNEHAANITGKMSDISKVAESTETLTQRTEYPTQQNDKTVDNTFCNNNNNNCNVNKQNENISGNVMNHSVSSVGDMRANAINNNNKVGSIYQKNNQPVDESITLRSVEEGEESHLTTTDDNFFIQVKGKKGEELFSTMATKCFSSVSWPYLNPPDKSMSVEVTPNPSTVSSPIKIQEKSKNISSCHSIKGQRNFSFSLQQQQQKNNVKLKNRCLKKKSKPILDLPPPVPVVSPSSSNGSTSDSRACKNIVYLGSGENVHTSMRKALPSTQMQNSPNAVGIKNQSGVKCNTHTKKKKNVIQTGSGTSYVELYHTTLPLYENNSPRNTSEDSLQVTPIRECQSVTQLKKHKGAKILHKHLLKPPPTNINKSQHDARKTEHNMKETANGPLSELKVDAIIKERNSFLKLCAKNRFYNNPNYNEPWKVFSMISEKILNDILVAVESDFSIGVSKFVEDFLEWETKAGHD